MKKVTSKDLALKKETVTALSDEMSSAIETIDKVKCFTHETCQTRCQQATCPDYSVDPNTTCNASYQSVCLCITQNEGYCDTRVCNASETQGPLCCGPIEETVNDACLFPMTNGTTCVQTMDKDCMVELSVENENGDYECNPVLLTENCPKETDNCEE